MNYVLAAIGIVFSILFAYQIIYALIGLFMKPVVHGKGDNNRFAVIISARNESAVIENLINSIKAQTYPQELIEIYVVADNCDDDTAEICRGCGVNVYERFNKEKVGKGYAMDYLFEKIFEKVGNDHYDGFFVFDADNILEPDFIEQMNNTFSAGYKVVTGYRNSTNFGANWISAGYGVNFIKEARYVNYSRMILKSSCAISGTGFLMHKDLLKKSGGWKYYLLTEDIEFTVATILDGEKIGYCHKAVFYDEQPETFVQSWNQRLRWAKGFLQVFRHYGGKLIKGIFTNKGNRLACLDLTLKTMPVSAVILVMIIANIVNIVMGVVSGEMNMWGVIVGFWNILFGGYGTFMFMGALTVITEWKYINCTNPRKILYIFTFPFYMATYLPIGIVALFKKVEWTPIKHYGQQKNHKESKEKEQIPETVGE